MWQVSLFPMPQNLVFVLTPTATPDADRNITLTTKERNLSPAMVSGTTPLIIQPNQGVAQGTKITIPLPDDFHHHCRDGLKTAAILKHATERFGRCLFMPNIQPPVTTTEKAVAYKKHIMDSLPEGSTLEPIMVLYLTDKTTAEEIYQAHAAGVAGVKYYPAGATTNSEHGVSDITNCYPALQALSDKGMMLCIHSEVTAVTIDIFEREPAFIESVIKPLTLKFPKLKMTMEHISTKQAVEYVMNEAPENVKASITCHHLLYNRNRKWWVCPSQHTSTRQQPS